LARKADPLSHRVKASASDARNEIAHVASNGSEAASNGAIGHQHITEATREARKRRALDALRLVERYRFTYETCPQLRLESPVARRASCGGGELATKSSTAHSSAPFFLSSSHFP